MIGIISDTHDNVPKIKKAAEMLKDNKVTLVIHLGDIISGTTVNYFKGLPVKFLPGNCVMEEKDILKSKIEEINGELLKDPSEMKINGKTFFLTHKPIFKEKIGKYDYIFHGHDHVKKDQKISNTRIINPGSLYSGDKENSMALLDLDKDKLRFINI